MSLYFGRVNDVERVSHEKDYYFKLIDERNQEILTLKTLKEKLCIQLEEREKNFLALQQQVCLFCGRICLFYRHFIFVPYSLPHGGY